MPPVPMLDFSRAYGAQREEILAALTAVADSQRYVGGPQIESFERAAALACGTPHAAGCASGTDALWLALAACGIGPGDQVLSTPFSFFATASAILRCGATPVFADIDPATFNLSPTAVEKVLDQLQNRVPDSSTVSQSTSKEHQQPTPGKIKAILPVHLYGQPADMDALKSFGLPIIEDAAQSFGALWNGQPAGSLGTAAAFSFYPTKNLSAMGEAGLVTTADPAIDEKIRSLRAHGMKVRYFHDEVGWNARMDTLQAAVLQVKLRHLPSGNDRRRTLAARYDDLFLDASLAIRRHPEERSEKGPPNFAGSTTHPITLPDTDPRATHVFHQYVIRCADRDALRAHLTAQQICTEIYYPLCLHQQKALTHLGYRTGDFPEAERAAAEVLALPMYAELREDEQDTVVAAVRSFYT